MRIYLITLLLVLPSGILHAQQRIIQPDQMIQSSFVIIVDQDTYDACTEEINAYRDLLQTEGLATFIISARWQSPEHVKFFLEKYYTEQSLEGAVFIGNVPVAMIRDAQHMTSAFKMDQKRFPLIESSVPSDRFYDDFDLVFNLLERDSVRNFYYYSLDANSPQRISCEIYTGRIKPTQKGEAGFDQIKGYLRKLVTERKKENVLNVAVSYTGEGSYSNSLTAWKDGPIVLEEQFPLTRGDTRNSRHYLFNMMPFMKDVVINELRRDNVDVMLFHEHGTPDRQYLTGYPPADGVADNLENGRFNARQYLRRQKRYGYDIKKAKAQLMVEHSIDSTWFAGAFDQAVIEADSVFDLKTGIILSEIPDIKPNPSLVIFDACYNGDFREDDFIANQYIFADGKTIACFANSVNVLQDKSATDLLGMMAYGFRLGDWTRHINILESHIIGDPTFRFQKPSRFPKIRLNSTDTSYWKSVLSHNLPPDVQSIALYKLFDLEYPGLSKLLLNIYEKSTSYSQRLQCMHLLQYFNDGSFTEFLKKGVNDPYEFIRRRSAYYIGKVGTADLLRPLVNLYLNDSHSERVEFNVTQSLGHFNTSIAEKIFKEEIEKADFIFNKEKYWNTLKSSLDARNRIATETWNMVVNPQKTEKERLFYISTLRNNPYPYMVDDLLIAVANKEESKPIRLAIAEALGWFSYSPCKEEIIKSCTRILERENNLDNELSAELLKTTNRLKTYIR